MIIISKVNIRIDTVKWKVDLKAWDYAQVSKSTYKWLKTNYKNSFEFLPYIIRTIKQTEVNWKEYKEWDVFTVEKEEKYNSLINLNKQYFVWIETIKDYKKYVSKKIELEEEKTEEKSIEIKEEEKTENEIISENIEENKTENNI